MVPDLWRSNVVYSPLSMEGIMLYTMVYGPGSVEHCGGHNGIIV